MKNKFIFLLSFLSVFTLIGCNKNKEEYKIITKDSIKYLIYSGDEKVAMVVGYDQDIKDEVVIPETVDGYKVNAIRHESFVMAPITKITIPNSVLYVGYRSFKECVYLKDVILSNSIDTIYPYTFENCLSLENITIPDSVIEIQTGAFIQCQNLSKINIPSNVEAIYPYTFSYCSSLDNVDLSKSKINEIDDYTFSDCYNLKNIKFNNLSYLNKGAFYNCSSLKEINLPDSLTYIEDRVFYCCSSLDKIFIPSNVLYIGRNVFYQCKDNFKIMMEASEVPLLFNNNFNCYYPYILGVKRDTKTSEVFVDDNNVSYAINNYKSETPYATLLYPNEGFNKNLVVPDLINFGESKNAHVTNIADNAFIANDIIETLDLSTATKFSEIGKYSFEYSSIKSVTFNEEFTSIGDYAFNNCYNLTEINLSNTKLDYIGECAFYFDYNINTISLPENENEAFIDYGAFYKCRKLSSINNLDKIKDLSLCGYTFAECFNLGSSKENPFKFTPNIKSITKTDFLDFGTSKDQYIKISKDAYTINGEDVYLTCNKGNTIKLEKIDNENYRNEKYFYNAIINLEPKE